MPNAFRGPLLFVALLVILVGGALVLRHRTAEPPPSDGSGSLDVASTEAEPAAADVHPAYGRGVEALRERDLVAARSRFEEVPAGDPGYVLAQHALAGLDTLDGHYPVALSRLDAILPLQPDNPALYLSRSKTQLRAGRYRPAEFDALRAIEIDPEHADARYMVGLCRIAREDVQGGIAAYVRASAADLSGEGLTRAWSELERLRQERPDLAAAHYAAAWFASEAGNVEVERAALARYLELDPDGLAASNARERLEIVGD